MNQATDPTNLKWMSRCFELARSGIGSVSPNPPVGAVLVLDSKILGEGFHTHFGGPHAEVEAFRNVPESMRHLIPLATLYVSLEPCCITGKTPPCTDLILREGVKDVRIAIADPNPEVAGKGIELLRSHGVKITLGILEAEAQDLIRSFKTNIIFHRPYVILKWAQSIHGYIGKPDEKIWLSHPHTSIWTHKQRSFADAIMVGARTVMLDDPLLTNREYTGKSPHRVIYDLHGRLNNLYRVFNDEGVKVFYFSKNENKNIAGDHIHKYELSDGTPHYLQILQSLFLYKIGILLVEGGTFVHNLFIQYQAWDEAYVIHTSHPLEDGIKAPIVKGRLAQQIPSSTDTITCILNDDKAN
ncbi:MAG: bifunctional diaminohydroxyphosphoribosylaminopyrimidine deaminase/5-amino-6-(5-phosphoribosylamino)uracil reductase RibD [Saprospiraceae bacterium]